MKLSSLKLFLVKHAGRNPVDPHSLCGFLKLSSPLGKKRASLLQSGTWKQRCGCWGAAPPASAEPSGLRALGTAACTPHRLEVTPEAEAWMVPGRHALRQELSKVGPRALRGLCDQERKAEPRVTGQGERDPLAPRTLQPGQQEGPSLCRSSRVCTLEPPTSCPGLVLVTDTDDLCFSVRFKPPFCLNRKK